MALKAKYPNAGSVEVPLTDVFDGLIKVLPPVDAMWQDMALVNTRAPAYDDALLSCSP